MELTAVYKQFQNYGIYWNVWTVWK